MKNREKGIVLPIVLIIMIILGVLGLALIGRMSFDARAEKISEDRMQAHYLAWSGLLVAKDYLQQNQTSLVKNSITYVYGNLNSTDSSQAFAISNSIPGSTYNILVKCEITNDNKVITMTATGSYNSQSDIIKSTLNLNADGTLTEGEALQSAADAIADGKPLAIPKVDGNSFLDARNVSFYDDKGKKTSFIDATGAIKNNVELHSTKTTDSVIYDATVMVNFHQHVSLLSTGAMFFANPVTSLLISNQADLQLVADFIAFYGDVKIQNNNDQDATHLYLKTNNSTLTENLLKKGGSSTLKYGLVYFGKNFYTGRDANIPVKEEDNTTNLHGYYFFPDGIKLPSQSASLIPAREIITSSILSQLHIPGTFQGTQSGSGDNMTYEPPQS